MAKCKINSYIHPDRILLPCEPAKLGDKNFFLVMAENLNKTGLTVHFIVAFASILNTISVNS